MKSPLGTFETLHLQEFEQLCTRDEAGSQDLLQQRYVPAGLMLMEPFSYRMLGLT